MTGHGCGRTALLAIVIVLTTCAGLGQSAGGAVPQATGDGSGVLRLWGYDGMRSLIERWEKGFQREHPGIRFKNTLPGAAAAMAGTYTGVADISVMGRELWPNETMAFWWVYQYLPYGVQVVTSGLASPGQSYSPVVMANASNPLRSISLEQLDGIYGNEHRRGGKNLRVWGDLGLTGVWANRPIHVYGYGVDDPLGVYFRKTVLLGDFKPNVSEHLLTDRTKGSSVAARMRAAVQSDPLAIGYGQLSSTQDKESGGVKALPLAAEPGGAVLPATEQSVSDRSYPLTRSLSFYVNRAPGKPLRPELLAFLRYVLSEEGQAMVAADGHFLPLAPKLAQAETEALTREKTAERDQGRSDAQDPQ